MKGKFKVGDRVIVNGKYDGLEIDNQRGRVLYAEPKSEILIEFDELFSNRLHSGCGKGKEGFCWWIGPCCWDVKIELEPKNETIVIYRKGNDVIALDKANNKKAVARCNPEDTFDFETGARLAFERLFEAKKTPLNTKIVFTDGDDVFKTGHIYEIKDGNLVDPRYKRVLPGGARENFTKFYSIEELEDYFTAYEERNLHDTGWSFRTLKFIEIKED